MPVLEHVIFSLLLMLCKIFFVFIFLYMVIWDLLLKKCVILLFLYFFWNYIYIDKLFVQGAIKSLARDINQQVGGLEDSSIHPRFKEAVTPTDGKHAGTLSCGTWEQRRVRLLLEFLEDLEKSIHNAAEGCATAMLPPPKVSSSSLLHSTLSARKSFSVLYVLSLYCIFFLTCLPASEVEATLVCCHVGSSVCTFLLCQT